MKLYWPDQSDGEDKKLDFIPLHIPYTCRFIYGYGKTEMINENAWTTCGCPEEPECPGKVCEWELTREVHQKNMFVHPNIDVWINDAGHSSSFEQVGFTLGTVRVRETYFGPILYEGPIEGSPYHYPLWLHIFVWQLFCYHEAPGGGPDKSRPPILNHGCTQDYSHAVVESGSNSSPQCNRSGKSPGPFQFYDYLNQWQFNKSDVNISGSDYPPYETTCAGPSPC